MHESLEEIEDERGYRFYVNKTTKVKYKENPALILIIKRIKSTNQDIKYSTYRSAIKLIHLKNALFTYCIPFRCAKSIIEKHKFGSSQESVNPNQLTSIIHDIFYAAEKAGFYIENHKFRLTSAISVLCNFMWNIFDPKRQNNLSLMELKLTILILFQLNPANTYHELIDAHFDIAKDHNSCITRARFEEFINIFAKVLTYLGEPLYFERKVIEEIVNDAFACNPGINGVSHFSFTNLWVSHDNNSSFSTYTNLFLLLIRFKKSELVVHQNQCVSCSKFPIVGMRFKCQKCKKLNLCFTCFSKGFVNSRHSNAHRMFELTTNDRPTGKFMNFLTKFFKIFTRKSYDLNHPIAPTKTDEINEGYSKFIENKHVELYHVDDDMDEGGSFRKRCGTIRNEIFDSSENALIAQRSLTEKLYLLIEKIKSDAMSFENTLSSSKINEELKNSLMIHKTSMIDQIEQLKNIHDVMTSFLGCSQSNKTIKSSLTSPTVSLFIPHSSTPYQKLRRNLKEIEHKPMSILNDSMNGCEFNKSFVSENADVSISDISCWFQTQMPEKGVKKSTKIVRRRSLADESFETKVANFRNLLLKVKEIIDDSYSDNIELARTTATLERVVIKIIDDEEKKRQI